MVNKGSPLSALNIVNLNELIWKIREGEIKVFVYDEDSEQWVRLTSRLPVPKSPTNIDTGQIVVPHASTPLGSGEIVSVILRASNKNSGVVYVGTSGVSDAVGYPLEPGETIALNIDNLNKIYLFAQVSGDIVRYMYVSP